MHKHQNDKNEMTISSLNITYLYSFFPHGKWIVHFFFFAPAWLMIELKHNNVKFQIDFPILLFFPFLPSFFWSIFSLVFLNFFFVFVFFTPTVFDTIFLSRLLFFCIEGKTTWICGLRLYTEPVEIKKYLKC